jgi:uncharacterized protein with PIN domain
METKLKSTPAQLRAAKRYRATHPAQHKAGCKAWRMNNPEKAKAANRNRDKKLGEGAQMHFDDRMSQQNNRCAVCETPLIKSPRLDHNHATGQWRGAVCPRCNIALGYYENEHLMALSLAYLKSWQEEAKR